MSQTFEYIAKISKEIEEYGKNPLRHEAIIYGEQRGEKYNAEELLNFIHSGVFKLGEAEKPLLNYLIGLSKNCYGACYPSQFTLADKFEVTHKRISQLVKRLREKGLLKVYKSQIGQVKHNIYVIPTMLELKATVSENISKLKSKINCVMKETAEKARLVIKTCEKLLKDIFRSENKEESTGDNAPVTKKESTTGATKNAKKNNYNKANKGSTPFTKHPIRKEIVPDWATKPYEPKVRSLEELQDIDRERKELEMLILNRE